MKTYFINSGFHGCFYARCLVPMAEGGWTSDQDSIYRPVKSSEERAQGALKSDVVVFHRPMSPDKIRAGELFKGAGKLLVLDNDDTYMDDSGIPPAIMEIYAHYVDDYLSKVNAHLKSFIKMADLITVSTPFLKKEYEHLNDNIVVLPNYICEDDWPEPKRNDGEKIRIGLVGSVAICRDHEVLIPWLEQLPENVQLVMFALPKDAPEYKVQREVFEEIIKFWDKFPIEWHPYVPISQYRDKLNSLELDLMLIPRKDNYFNRCKSNIKLLEASMLEIPVIAQSFESGDGPYDKDGDGCILATTEEDWIEKINSLIGDREKLRELGRKAKEYVLSNYNIKDHIHKWEEAYEEALRRKQNT